MQQEPKQPISDKEFLALTKQEQELYEPATGYYYYSSNFSDDNRTKPRPWAECKNYAGFGATPLTYKLKPVEQLKPIGETVNDIVYKAYPEINDNPSGFSYNDVRQLQRAAMSAGYHYRNPEFDKLESELALKNKYIAELESLRKILIQIVGAKSNDDTKKVANLIEASEYILKHV